MERQERRETNNHQEGKKDRKQLCKDLIVIPIVVVKTSISKIRDYFNVFVHIGVVVHINVFVIQRVHWHKA